MKKVLKLLIITVLTFATLAGLVACDGSNGKAGEKGIICKKLTGDDFYTVIGYGAEDDKDVLDISAAAQEKYGENGAKTIVVGRIRAGAFDGNTSLKEIIVKDDSSDVELTIDAGAFKNMRSLKKITLPFIGANRFTAADLNGKPANYDEDETAVIKATDKERLFGYIFGEEESDVLAAITQTYGDVSEQTATFYIPATLTEVVVDAAKDAYIPMYAFSGVPQISKITVLGKIKAIGKAAFKGAAHLKTLTIPETVAAIYENAFKDAKLTVLTFGGTKAQWNAIDLKDGWDTDYKLTKVICAGEDDAEIDLTLSV